MRMRRWQALRAVFPDVEQMEVVDLGGTVESWKRAPVRPRRVTVINLTSETPVHESGIDTVQADACELDVDGLERRVDLVYCNSVIEHVGGHARRRQLSETIHRLAPRHWVQAPYRYFPVEPHWLFPGLQFLPLALRARLVRRWPLGSRRPSDLAAAVEDVAGVELPSKTEMRLCFPGSTLLRETIGPLTKSLIAVRGCGRLKSLGRSEPSLRALA
jgi:hypothetical protein